MITVDIYTPFLGVTYDFSLDETVTISTVIEEIAAMICAKERWPYPSNCEKLGLFSPTYKRELQKSKTLFDESIKTGQRLILC